MKIIFVKSLDGYLWDGDSPVAKEENRGKAARMRVGNERTIGLILPCGHHAVLDGWKIEDIDTDAPSATPSIFCSPQIPCWHGYLTKGELIQV